MDKEIGLQILNKFFVLMVLVLYGKKPFSVNNYSFIRSLKQRVIDCFVKNGMLISVIIVLFVYRHLKEHSVMKSTLTFKILFNRYL